MWARWQDRGASCEFYFGAGRIQFSVLVRKRLSPRGRVIPPPGFLPSPLITGQGGDYHTAAQEEAQEAREADAGRARRR
jgi:hypothetical protein